MLLNKQKTSKRKYEFLNMFLIILIPQNIILKIYFDTTLVHQVRVKFSLVKLAYQANFLTSTQQLTFILSCKWYVQGK